MADDVENYLWRLLDRVQKNQTLRNIAALVVVIGLVGLAGKFVYDLLPRHYQLTVTGGDLLGNRHYLAKLLQEEVASSGVALKIVPTGGSEEALDQLDDGKLDLAFIQGGLDANYPHVQHVATLPPELIHFLVKPAIAEVKDLKGKIINLGGRGGGTRVVSKEILRYSGLRESIDYSETNFSNEDLIGMRSSKLPDVVVLISYAPSDVADFLVKQRGYKLLEMPFPPSLAARLGWVADTKILGYMYSIAPPVPNKDIEVVGVNLHLVANAKVDPRAVSRVLEALYNPKIAARFGQKIAEADILVSSGFPVSAGTGMFMARNDPFLPTALFDKIKATFGLLMSVASTVLVAYKWFRPSEPEETKDEPESDDGKFKAYLGRIAEIDRGLAEIGAAEAAGAPAALAALGDKLSAIKREAMELAEGAKLDDPSLLRTVMLCIADTRAELQDAAGRTAAAPPSLAVLAQQQRA